MTFIGYVVNGKPFGAGQYEKAKEYAKEQNAEIKIWKYKV